MEQSVTDEGDPTAALADFQLETRRVEVRLTRAAVKARLFGRAPESTRVGRFVVLERVGMGGMGVVYAAYDPQLDRRVALKVMRDDVVRSRRALQQQQLLREARAMAKVSHPNVVAVYDAGTVDGQVFVAMEFIEAVTLRDWIAREPPVDELLRVFVEAGQGLATAHAAGLVHRDFKPENVLVPDQGAVRVTDFGLARAVDRPALAPAGTPALTQGSGSQWALAGTPAYMSPQQLRGQAVDARADQWAFCVALFEALNRAPPFDQYDVLAMEQGQPVTLPPLPESVLTPARVRAAIERGLMVDPDERFEDMASLLAVLVPRRRSLAPLWAALVAGAAVLGGVAIAQDDAPVCPRATEQFTGVWDEATRTTMAQALASASPSLGTPTWARVEPIVGDHVSRWLDLRQQSCRSAEEGALSAELLDLRMACLDTRHNELSALLETWADADAEIVAHAVEASVQLTPLSTCRDPRILRELTPPGPSGAQREQGEAIRKQIDRARALRRGGKSAQALTIVGAAVDAAVALDDPTTTIEARLERGRIRAELADRDGATADFDAVIEQGGQARYLSAVAEAAVALVDVVGVDLARVDAGLDLARTASVAVALGSDATLMRARLDLARGRVLYLAGRTEEGLAATRRGMELLGGPQADERARLQQAEALQLLAKMALAKDDPKAAHDNAQRALAIFEQLLGDDHPQVATSLAHGAAADLRAGRVEQARAQFARAARIQRDAYGPRHPAYGRTVANLGSALREAYDFEGARRQYREAADILEDALGADDPRVATVWANIGAVEFELHDLPAAEAAYVRGLAGLRKSMGERHPQTALTLANLGRAQLERGHVEQASTTLRQALSIREEVLGTDHVQTARSRVSLAHALMAQHRHADAVDAYTAALEVLEARRAPPTEVASARAFLGRAQWENGERRVARALFERARPGLSEADRADHDAWCDGRCGSG